MLGFVDVDLSRDVDSSNCISKYIYTIDRTTMNWIFRLQNCVTILMKNSVYNSKTKHIRRQYHFTNKSVEECDVYLEKIKGAKNLTDILTKCVDIGKLKLCKVLVKILMMKRISGE